MGKVKKFMKLGDWMIIHKDKCLFSKYLMDDYDIMSCNKYIKWRIVIPLTQILVLTVIWFEIL